MKELRNSVDYEARFTDLEEAKRYYVPDLDEFPEEAEYAKEILEAESMEELADVLNKYTDEFDNGSEYKVVEF